MRPLWAWLALLLFTFVLLAYAQDVNDLTDGEAVNFDLAYGSSATFHLEPPSSSSSNSNVREYYVTLNICSAPSGANFTALDNFDLLFAFTSEDTDIASRADASSADHGYANVTTTTAKSSDKGLWVTVTAPPTNQSGGNDNDEWSFQVAVSTSSPVHVLDRAPLWALQDTDNSSMLLTGPTFFPSLSQSKGGGDPGGDVFIFPTPQDPSISALLQLYKSSCLVQDSDNVIGSDSDQVNSTTTSRGAFTLSAREGALEQAREQHEAGGQRTQLYVTDLEPDTNYTIWGIQSGDGDRNRLFMPQFASTKSTDRCRLLFDLSPCSGLAYSVPAPPEMSTADIAGAYTSRLQRSLDNFNTTLRTFSCDIPSQGRFSSVRTCDDCFAAYENWLCGVTMPRCTDMPPDRADAAQSNYTVNANQPNQIVFNNEPIPESVQTTLIRTNPAASRTPQWSESALQEQSGAVELTTPFPYAEIPPCSGVCNLVAASCPNLISWQCPIVDQTLTASYGRMELLPADEQLGGNHIGPANELRHRSSDRFGNVFCNSFELEVLLDLRASGQRLVLSLGMGAVMAATGLALLL